MRNNSDPNVVWDETCEGSALALAIFVGPSPSGNKPARRRPMNKNCCHARWNESFDTYSRWRFRDRFKSVVEALFSSSYKTAGKLIGRANLDWVPNPNSKDVQEQHMRQGAPSTLKMIEDCSPELVVPMDKKTFDVLKTVMEDTGFVIAPCNVINFKVRIKKRFNRCLYAFQAKSPAGMSFLVIKLPQHPSRMFPEYDTRCGEAIREAATQIASGQPVNTNRT